MRSSGSAFSRMKSWKTGTTASRSSASGFSMKSLNWNFWGVLIGSLRGGGGRAAHPLVAVVAGFDEVARLVEEAVGASLVGRLGDPIVVGLEQEGRELPLHDVVVEELG